MAQVFSHEGLMSELCQAGQPAAEPDSRLLELVDAVRRAGIIILVHGWKKNRAGRWVLREVDCS